MRNLLLCLMVVVAGCGQEKPKAVEPEKKLTLNGAEYRTLEGARLESTDAFVKGTGSLIFRNPLPAKNNHMKLKFQLEDGGALTLISNSSRPDLGDGIKLRLQREGKVLHVELNNANLDDKFAAIDASQALDLPVEVHDHGHIFVWIKGVETEIHSRKVTGRLWGFSLEKSTLTQAKLMAAQAGG